MVVIWVRNVLGLLGANEFVANTTTCAIWAKRTLSRSWFNIPWSSSRRSSVAVHFGRRLAAGNNESTSKNAAELASKQTVDEEVDRRVDGVQRVAHDVDVTRRLLVDAHAADELERRHGQPETDIGQLADDKHADDNDQHERQILSPAGTAPAARLPGPTSAGRDKAASTTDEPKSDSEAGVEKDEDDERSDWPQNDVADRLVSEEIDSVLMQPRLRCGGHRVIGARVDDRLELNNTINNIMMLDQLSVRAWVEFNYI